MKGIVRRPILTATVGWTVGMRRFIITTVRSTRYRVRANAGDGSRLTWNSTQKGKPGTLGSPRPRLPSKKVEGGRGIFSVYFFKNVKNVVPMEISKIVLGAGRRTLLGTNPPACPKAKPLTRPKKRTVMRFFTLFSPEFQVAFCLHAPALRLTACGPCRSGSYSESLLSFSRRCWFSLRVASRSKIRYLTPSRR